MSFELQSVLAQVVQQLATFFGTTAEAISANAPEWLAKYGRYCLIGEVSGNLIFGSIMAGLLILFILLGMYGLLELEHPAWGISAGIIVVIFLIVAAVVVPVMQCNIAPEIYGLQQAMKLINGG